VWSIFSCLYPARHNPDRLQNYDQYEKTLNLDGLEFPLAVKDIPKFEAQNPTIAIHCIAADSKNKSFSILYLSPRVHQRDHTLTLLLLDDERRSKNHHYVFVKNLSSLIADRSKNKHRSLVCLSCLQVFSSKQVLKKHERCCLVHSSQQVVFPDPEQRKLSFESHRYEHPFDFYFVSDFESILIKKPRRIDECHQHSRNCRFLSASYDVACRISDCTYNLFRTECYRKVFRTNLQ